MSVARAGSSVALVAIAWLLAGCGERPPAQAATQPGPATASSSTRIRALESTPQAREWLGQQRFEREARDFVRAAPGLPTGERERRAQALETQIAAREAAGELSAGDTLLLRAAMIEAMSGSEAEQKARSAELSDPTVYDDAARRNKLLGDYQAAQDKLEELVPRWEKAMAELEAAKAALGGEDA